MSTYSIIMSVCAVAVFLIIANVSANAFFMDRLKRWAAVRRLTIVSARRRYLFGGPFFGVSPAYYITVRRPDGRESNAYARLWGWWTVDVHWVFESEDGSAAQ